MPSKLEAKLLLEIAAQGGQGRPYRVRNVGRKHLMACVTAGWLSLLVDDGTVVEITPEGRAVIGSP